MLWVCGRCGRPSRRLLRPPRCHQSAQEPAEGAGRVDGKAAPPRQSVEGAAVCGREGRGWGKEATGGEQASCLEQPQQLITPHPYNYLDLSAGSQPGYVQLAHIAGLG